MSEMSYFKSNFRAFGVFRGKKTSKEMNHE